MAQNDNASATLRMQQLTQPSVLPNQATKNSIGYGLYANLPQPITVAAGIKNAQMVPMLELHRKVVSLYTNH